MMHSTICGHDRKIVWIREDARGTPKPDGDHYCLPIGGILEIRIEPSTIDGRAAFRADLVGIGSLFLCRKIDLESTKRSALRKVRAKLRTMLENMAP